MQNILFLVADEYEDLELFYPYYRLKESGYNPVIAASKKGALTGKHNYQIQADVTFSEVRADDYVALVLPGGKSPERVRLDKDALTIVKYFMSNGHPVAAICHGPQILISAGLVKGRRMTCWKGVRDDLIAAGAMYEDSSCVVDRNLVTARQPSDLHAFMKEFLNILKLQKTEQVQVV
ncbi:MAG: type 1 glutamine amidotransferase domain-containing protein [Nitrososphaerota archaeon]